MGVVSFAGRATDSLLKEQEDRLRGWLARRGEKSNGEPEYAFEIVAGESARGLMALTMDGLAVGNGILTVENEAQAIARANPKHANKGGGAAEAALALLDLKSKLS